MPRHAPVRSALVLAAGLVAGATLVAGGHALAQNAGPSVRPAPAAPTAKAPDLHEAMEQSGRALRGLRRTNFAADTRPRDLAAIHAIQQALLHAKAGFEAYEMPMAEAAEERYGADRATYLKDFRRALVASLEVAVKLEAAVLDEKPEAAKALLQQLVQSRNDGHRVFQP